MGSGRRNAELAQAGPSHARFVTLDVQGIGHAQAHHLARPMTKEPAMRPFGLHDIDLDDPGMNAINRGDAPAGQRFERHERQ